MMLASHGHVHDYFDYALGNTRVLCNPRGYVGIDDGNGFDPGLVVEVSNDPPPGRPRTVLLAVSRERVRSQGSAGTPMNPCQPLQFGRASGSPCCSHH